MHHYSIQGSLQQGGHVMASRAAYKHNSRLQRKGDPYLDRRSGEDRRKIYSIDFFLKGNRDRRQQSERRANNERREDCVRINQWASVCPDKNELDNDKSYSID